MILHCPHCGSHASIEVFASAADARRFAALALTVSAPIGAMLPDYLRLFRPKEQALKWKRALSLLQPLVDDIKRGAIRRKGRDWPVTESLWADAFNVIEQRHDLELPLNDHAYLYEILRRESDKVEAQAETKKIDAERDAERQRIHQRQCDPVPGDHQRALRSIKAILAQQADK